MLLYHMIIMYVLFGTYSEFDQVRDCYLASDHHILVVFFGVLFYILNC